MTRSSTIVVVVALVGAVAVGSYLIGRSRAPAPHAPAGARTEAAAAQVWTCSMHPQVRLPNPGSCPICEMPLIPAASASVGSGPPSMQLSEHAMAMASVETTEVTRRALSRELRAVGRIVIDEPTLTTITPRFDGYAERLFVNVTGVEIQKGEHLAEVYSPELLVAQQEFLILIRSGGEEGLVELSRRRLSLLGLTDQQVAALVERQEPTDHVTLYSPVGGTIIEKSVVERASFSAGDRLYTIANLDSVWAEVEVYEFDLPWIRFGQAVRLTSEAYPGRTFEGRVSFVRPRVDAASRTISIPVMVMNEDHALMPGMFVTATVDARLGADGRAASTGVEGKFSCSMHPHALSETAGPCPVCGMPLERVPGAKAADPHAGHAAAAAPAWFCPMKCEGEKTYDAPGRCPVCEMKLVPVVPPAPPEAASEAKVLAIPVTAVLDSGSRQLAYVEKGRGLFESRPLSLGPRAGDWFPVLSGVDAGERVVTRGNFLIDSQFQVTGHPSLFYPGGLAAPPAHTHGEAAPSASTPTPTPASTPLPAATHTGHVSP